jgi:hypothetical protein
VLSRSNRSLAKQLEIAKVASTFDPCNASPAERNVFRTWMICHNLDAITALVSDRPSSFGSISPEHKRWPRNPDDSLEGIVGVLTTPLRLIDLHVKQQSVHNILCGADIVLAIVSVLRCQRNALTNDRQKQGESTISPRLLDAKIVDTMTNGILEQRALSANKGGGPLSFWLHLAHM